MKEQALDDLNRVISDTAERLRPLSEPYGVHERSQMQRRVRLTPAMVRDALVTIAKKDGVR